MLVHCPKCGFSQPKDQYCAQCGVDMYAYKPPQESPVKKFFTNPLVHVSVLAIIAVGAFLTISHRKKESATMSYLKTSDFPRRLSEQNSTDQDRTAPAATDPQSSAEIPPTAATTEQTIVPTNNSGSTAETVSASSETSPREFNNKNANLSFKTKIIYAEVSRRAFDMLVEESLKLGQYNVFGDYAAGVIANGNKKISSWSREMRILKTENENLEIGKVQNLVFNYKMNEREPASLSPEINYSTQIILDEVDANSTKGHLEVIKSLKENPENKINFPATFEIPTEGSFFISGLGAHPEGAKPESEFLILVQFEKQK